MTRYSDLQLDALRELANVGSGTASTALSGMLGRSVDISVPSVNVLPMADAVGAIGDAEAEATGVVLGVIGDMPASVLLLFTPSDAAAMCGFLGVEAGTEIGDSALMEIGNIMGASYLNALGQMTGMELEPTPPASATDMLGAIVQTVLAERAGAGDIALLLDSDLVVEDSDASVSVPARPRSGWRGSTVGSVGPVAMAETMVRMGELAASAVAGDVLVSLGLGSCIGLALVDRRQGVAGLAHVVLPTSGGNAEPGTFKFADHAVPELIDRMLAAGARRPNLDAVLVGGASMFTVSSASLEVGQRNEAAVRDELDAAHIRVIASETGGTRGRTIRVHVATRRITVREAGGIEHDLVPAMASSEAAA